MQIRPAASAVISVLLKRDSEPPESYLSFRTFAPIVFAYNFRLKGAKLAVQVNPPKKNFRYSVRYCMCVLYHALWSRVPNAVVETWDRRMYVLSDESAKQPQLIYTTTIAPVQDILANNNRTPIKSVVFVSISHFSMRYDRRKSFTSWLLNITSIWFARRWHGYRAPI